MSATDTDECCPRFDPGPWDETELVWHDKRFLKDHVTSFLHIPLNYGAVMKRSTARIEAADAKPPAMMTLADESSPWRSEIYLEVTREVPGAEMASLSGTFVTKVFEGPFRDMQKWLEQMKTFLRSRDKAPKKLYFYYTTCPKCAKKYGKNYVVILAEV